MVRSFWAQIWPRKSTPGVCQLGLAELTNARLHPQKSDVPYPVHKGIVEDATRVRQATVCVVLDFPWDDGGQARRDQGSNAHGGDGLL